MKQESYARLLAQRLSGLTKESGKSIKELSKEIDISVGALSNYQNVKAEPGLTALCAIADYFEVPVDWLVGRSQVKDPKAAEAAVCEYLRLSEDNVALWEEYTSGGYEEEHRVRGDEFANWLMEQKEFRTMMNAIAASFLIAADDADRGTEQYAQDYWKKFIHNLQDPKYVAMSSLLHLLDDRVDFTICIKRPVPKALGRK